MMFSSMYAYKGDNNYLKSPFIGIGDAEELELSFEYYNPEGERSPASMNSALNTTTRKAKDLLPPS